MNAKDEVKYLYCNSPLKAGQAFSIVRLLIVILTACLCTPALYGQNYTATNGSSYTGALNVHNNPAAIVNSPLKWDFCLFGFQEKHTTNGVIVKNYSLLSKPTNVELDIPDGAYRRYADFNFNLNLFNGRIALSRWSAIAFGANLKSYMTGQTNESYFSDTLGNFARYFLFNEGTTDMNYQASVSNWAELYFTYGQTIIDNEKARFNAGLTLKMNKGLAAGFIKATNIGFARTSSNPPHFRLSSAELDFGYSANYDRWDSKRSFQQNFSDAMDATKNNFSLDIGFEYLVKLQSIPSVFNQERFYDYDWKIGLSVLDIGYSLYPFGQYSTRARSLNADVVDTLLDQTLSTNVSGTLGEFRDSLSRLYTPLGTYTGNFGIGNPGRVVLNVDKFIAESFFINADLSISFSYFSKRVNLPARDLNLLTVTPRWETRKQGFYLPVYFNNRSQLWVGGAVRVGPVLFGLHNWGNLFLKNKIQRGGFYLALILKASDYTGTRSDKRLDCPR